MLVALLTVVGAVVQVEAVRSLDGARQERGVGDHKDRALHMLRVGRARRVGVVPLPQGLDEGEDLLLYGAQHRLGRELLEARPAEVLLVASKERLEVERPGTLRLALAARLGVVEALDEEQGRELLDDGERVRDAARPERGPDLIDPPLKRPCDHGARVGKEKPMR
ncbi:MAG: hypothetical protein AAGN64_12225 [Bacteroidota bacterium]